MNNKSFNTGIILGGIISLVSIIFISSYSNTLSNIDTNINTGIDLETNIFENKKIYKKILKIKVEQEYLEKINTLLIKESGLDKDPKTFGFSLRSVMLCITGVKHPHR